ncbi:MAG: amidase [Ktedonobacterales bacterium]
MTDSADSLLIRPALELAALVRSGDISARALTEAALRRIEANRDLNAFTLVDAEAALTTADAIQSGDPRPFAGVPTAIKELNAVAGQPLTMGSMIFGDYRPNYDSFVVRRMRDAGFISVGRTSAPEFGIVPVTEPRRFGPTRNPWDTNYTPGGSSGGAAAAVAAGMLPVAQGSDGGGSIRIPAACCGLFGLKPSRGRISSGPDEGDNLLATNGILTRTVADTAAILDVLSGYEVGDSTWAPPLSETFATAAAREPGRLRIAMTVESPLDAPVHPLAVQATHDAAQLLISLGHDIIDVTPPGLVAPQLIEPFNVVWGAGIATGVRFGAMVTNRQPAPELVESLTWAFYQLGISHSAADILESLATLKSYARSLVAFLAQFDMLLTPALGQRPFLVGELNTDAADSVAEFDKAAVMAQFTVPFNLTGQPAMALPLYQGPDGLPLAVQLVGRPLGEGALLALAAQIEKAHPWAGRLPDRLKA